MSTSARFESGNAQIDAMRILSMDIWFSKKREPKMKILDFKPSHWGKGTEKTSEEVDEILYGNSRK